MNSQQDKTARICMSIQTASEAEFADVLNAINSEEGMQATDLANNELAKSHLRHLVGGRAENVRCVSLA
jgi:threonine dehydratase